MLVGTLILLLGVLVRVRLRRPVGQWEDGVLEFYNTDRHVKTMSAAQVRRPIDRRALKAWEKYEPHLRPIMSQLSAKFRLREVLGHEWDEDPPALSQGAGAVDVDAHGAAVEV